MKYHKQRPYAKMFYIIFSVVLIDVHIRTDAARKKPCQQQQLCVYVGGSIKVEKYLMIDYAQETNKSMFLTLYYIMCPWTTQ